MRKPRQVKDLTPSFLEEAGERDHYRQLARFEADQDRLDAESHWCRRHRCDVDDCDDLHDRPWAAVDERPEAA